MTDTTLPQYEIILYWSQADRVVIAEVPELPGCMADGANYQSALEAVQIVMQEWIETAESMGRTVPSPKGRLLFA
jgi:predicted RNase H-like HicB family nuclease